MLFRSQFRLCSPMPLPGRNFHLYKTHLKISSGHLLSETVFYSSSRNREFVPSLLSETIFYFSFVSPLQHPSDSTLYHTFPHSTNTIHTLLPFLLPKCSIYTSNTEISAGETPDILAACPTEAGLKSLSFCLASNLKESILS